MMTPPPGGEREYSRNGSVVFRKTNEEFGGLSNMAPGYPLQVNGKMIGTSEVLYQLCRYPHLEQVQRMLLAERSPMTAKMKSRPYRSQSREDFDAIKVAVMRWCLRVKLVQNWSKFSSLLLATGTRPIVEFSKKDRFWGAAPDGDDTLVGGNVLGRLLMELRSGLQGAGRSAPSAPVLPPAVPGLLLLGEPIGPIEVPQPGRSPAANWERPLVPVRIKVVSPDGDVFWPFTDDANPEQLLSQLTPLWDRDEIASIEITVRERAARSSTMMDSLLDASNDDYYDDNDPLLTESEMPLATDLLGRRGPAASDASSARPADLDERLGSLTRELEATEEACLGVQVVSSCALDLTASLFGENGVVQGLAQWEGIRRNGFDLSYGGEPEGRGSSVLFGGPRWRGRIDVDGVLSIVIPARWDFLGWAMNKDSSAQRTVRINAVVLVEFIYDCFRFASRVLLPHSTSGSWSARVRAWRMKTAGVHHQAGQSGRWEHEWESAKTASVDDYAPPAMTITGRPEKDAFDSLARVYALWGLGPEAIPYVREGEVDPDAILAVRG